MEQAGNAIPQSIAASEKRRVRPFGIIDQVGYTFGDIAGSFVNLYVEAFFVVYCTYVLGITPAYLGVFFIFSRIWDAINDPLIGSIPDRVRLGKSGDKFKPYIKLGMVPLAIAGCLAFAPIYGLSTSMRYIIASIAYVLTDMTYTLTSMPYGSLVSVITRNPVERTKLSRARSIGGMIVGLGFLSFVPQFIVNNKNEYIPERFFMIALVFGALSLISYLVMLTCTTERVREAETVTAEKYNYREVLKGVARNRPLIGAMIATIGSLIMITGYSAVRTYLYKEYYGDAKILTAVSLLSVPIVLLLFPIVPWAVRKFGKRRTLLYTCVPSLAISVALFLVPIPNVYAYLVLSTIGGLGNNFFIMIVWSLVADCIDYQEYKTGVRKDGSVFSIFGFARKIGSAIASSVSMFMLSIVGYDSSLKVQTAEVAGGIRTIATLIPVVCFVLMVAGIGLIYNLNADDTEKINRELMRRHHEREGEVSAT